MRRKFDSAEFLSKLGTGKTVVRCLKGQAIFSQGDAADAVFYVQSGKVKMTVTSEAGKDPEDPKVRVVIRKSIPVAGGMAGGSADAAATLVGLASLWRLEISRDELSGLAAKLGADVPFALYGGTALGTGRGEQITCVVAPLCR